MPFTALALTLAFLLLGPSELYASKAATVVLEVQGERLILWAEDAPLAVILKQLAEAAHLRIYLEEPTQEPMSVDLVNIGLEEGLRRLLKHRNTLFLYTKHSRVPSVIYVLGTRGGPLAPARSPLTVAQPLASEPVEEGEVDVDGERVETRHRIEALEKTLRATVGETQEMSLLLQELMTDPDHAVRITALQWALGNAEAGIDALTTALSDGEDLVQRAAMQILLDHGAGEEAVAEVMAAAEDEHEKAVRQMLTALLAP